MFKVINSKTNKAIKDAITCKPMIFETKEQAEKFATSLTRDSVICATAWNRVRKTNYIVLPA